MAANLKTYPRMLVETLEDKNVPKAKQDDGYLREHNNVPDTHNDASPGIKTGVSDANVEAVILDDTGDYITLNL